jgi:hypothetical protein
MLASFSSTNRRAVYDCQTLRVVAEGDAALRQPPASPLEIQRVFRLPYLLVDAGEDFARRYAEECAAKMARFPGRPVPDPWDAEAEFELAVAVARAGRLIRDRVIAQWGFPPRDADILAAIAFSELRYWIAEVFEGGRDRFWIAASGPAEPAAATEPAKPQRKQRGETTDERLRELLKTDDGRRELLAAENLTAVGRLIDRSHAAVGASTVWKTAVKPLRDASRAYARAARQELDAERRY